MNGFSLFFIHLNFFLIILFNQNILLEIINANTWHLQQRVEERIMESQIFSLQWLKNDTLIACGANGLLKIFNFTTDGMCNIIYTYNEIF